MGDDSETGKEARRAESTSWGSAEAEAAEGPDLVVVAPSLLLTIDIETAPDGEDEIHIHPGGQGYWVAQMAAAMGARVRLCAVVGGEPGKVIVGLTEAEAIEFEPVVSESASSARIDDARHRRQTRLSAATPGSYRGDAGVTDVLQLRSNPMVSLKPRRIG